MNRVGGVSARQLAGFPQTPRCHAAFIIHEPKDNRDVWVNSILRFNVLLDGDIIPMQEACD